MKFYNVQKNWSKIKPIIETEECKNIWYHDLEISSLTKADQFGFDYHQRDYDEVEYPMDYDSCDWRYDSGRGRKPNYYKYVVHGRCHWVVNMNLYTAMKLIPHKEWRIVSGDIHSTVWNGEDMVFDINYFILYPKINEWWKELNNASNTFFLEPGVFLQL